MHLKIVFYKSILVLCFFIFFIGCQLQEPYQNHGILFLENRSNSLKLDISNKNDVIKIIGHPHSKSINDENEWFFVERTLTKGEFHKLGKNIFLLLKTAIYLLQYKRRPNLPPVDLFHTQRFSRRISHINRYTSLPQLVALSETVK